MFHKIFYIEVSLIIHGIIFLYVWPRRVNWIRSLRHWINLFNISMRVFDLNLLNAKCPDRNPKVLSSFLIFWSTMINYCWTLISSYVPLWLHKKKCSVKFSCLNRRLRSLYNFILDLYWLIIIWYIYIYIYIIYIT